MSMLPQQHSFDVEVTVLLREKVGDEDGTPIYEIRALDWPEGVSRFAYVGYDSDVVTTAMSANKIGSVTTKRATLIMEPTAYDVLSDVTTLDFDGHDDWRVDALTRPRGFWGPSHTEIVVSRQVNA